MARDGQSLDSPPPDPLEERLRRRLRLVAGVTFLGLVTILTLADAFGVSNHVNEFVFGSILGAFLTVAGISGIDRLFGRK